MKKSKKLIGNYTSDIQGGGQNDDGVYSNITFSIKAGMDDCIRYLDATSNCFCDSNLFTMRALVATFGASNSSRACTSVRFPVASPSPLFIKDLILQLKACGAICIDLDGEEWKVVPPGISPRLGYVPSYDSIPLPEGQFSPKVSGRMVQYEADGVFTRLNPKVSVEAEPVGLASLMVGAVTLGITNGVKTATSNGGGCAGLLAKQDICLLTNIKPRHAIVYGTSVGVDQTKTSKLVRKAPIFDRAEILDCIKTLGNYRGIQCVGYKGESIKNIHELVS